GSAQTGADKTTAVQNGIGDPWNYIGRIHAASILKGWASKPGDPAHINPRALLQQQRIRDSLKLAHPEALFRINVNDAELRVCPVPVWIHGVEDEPEVALGAGRQR